MQLGDGARAADLIVPRILDRSGLGGLPGPRRGQIADTVVAEPAEFMAHTKLGPFCPPDLPHWLVPSAPMAGSLT